MRRAAIPADDLSGRLEAPDHAHRRARQRQGGRPAGRAPGSALYLMETLAEGDAAAGTCQPSRRYLSQDRCAGDTAPVDHVLAERLDYLARRIDEMDFHPPHPVANLDDGAVRRLEGRLSDIAMRLEASTAAPPTDTQALRHLEEQIAHLSTLLMSEPRSGRNHIPADFDRRMSAIEDYMTTNDEYIIEAARHAAEAVVEAYSREGILGHGVPAVDMSAMTALAEDLRHLEDLSRSSDERTHRTFEALHDTLLQIADRLDPYGASPATAPAMPAAKFENDVFAHTDAAVKPPSAAPHKAGPVHPHRCALPIHGIAGNPAVAQAVDAVTKAEIKAAAKKDGAKSGLLANLGETFFHARKGRTDLLARPAGDRAGAVDRSSRHDACRGGE